MVLKLQLGKLCKSHGKVQGKDLNPLALTLRPKQSGKKSRLVLEPTVCPEPHA